MSPHLALFLALSAAAADPKPTPYDEFVVVPLRVHVLKTPGLEMADCKLTDKEVGVVLGKVNEFWHKAGVHFAPAPVVREEAEQVARFEAIAGLNQGEIDLLSLQMLRPRASRDFDGLHVYYFHELPLNGASMGDDFVIVMEGAQLREVAGGTDVPVARVTASTLGKALGLPGHADPTNLLANGTNGVALNAAQAKNARKLALTVRGAATAADLRKDALAAESKKDVTTARKLWTALAEIPGAGSAEAKRKRDALPR